MAGSMSFITTAMEGTHLNPSQALMSPNTTPMLRPGFGSKGKKFLVRVNCFNIQVPSSVCYHYDVKIQPEGKPSRVYRAVWHELCETLRIFNGVQVVYDGRSSAYSPALLPASEGSFEVDLPEADGSIRTGRGNRFLVKMKFARPIDLSALAVFFGGNRGGPPTDESSVLTCLQALNIVIQHTAMQTYPNRGASYFPPPPPADVKSRQIAKALEIWQGFYTSLRPGIDKIFVNLDLSSGKMIMQGNLPDVVVSFARSQNPRFSFNEIADMPPRLGIDLNRHLKGVRVSSTILGPDGKPLKRKILEITKQTAASSKFEYEGANISVADYFQKVYQYRVKNPNWPCIRVSKVALWPLELATVDEGQLYNRKLDSQQTADSLKLTTLGPNIRVPALRRGIASISPTNNGSVLNQWGIRIAPDPLEVEARLLPPPEINYAMNRKVAPREGVWNLTNQRLITPPKLPVLRWLVFIFERENFFTLQMVQPLLVGFVQGCNAVGMRIANARPDIVNWAPPNAANTAPSLIAYMKDCSKRAKFETPGPPDLIVCFLRGKPCPEYAIVKWVGDVEIGIPTQCLNIPIAKKKNGPQYWANLALKVNAKLGGVNSTLSPTNLVGFYDPKVPAMIMGADVTHSAPGSNLPSVAALVGTLDQSAAVYTTAIDVQSSRVEVMQNLEGMFTKLIRRFEDRNKVKPQRIIFFRDGVSEGQFPIVLDKELNAMKSASRMMDPSYNPQITYIVCGKRHHISIFPIANQDQDKTGNAKAGTVVDSQCVSPFQFDWYLQSHASLLGTSRSAHYTVLADDSNFTADVLQQLVYNLCYTYARCTRSVSYATPAYYADLVCGRAATLLSLSDDDTASTLGSGSQAEREKARLLDISRSRLKDIHGNHDAKSYWM